MAYKKNKEKEKLTTIAVPMSVKERIAEYGMKGETYTDVLERLLKSARERLLRDVLMDTSNCISIDEAIKEAEKKWPKSK